MSYFEFFEISVLSDTKKSSVHFQCQKFENVINFKESYLDEFYFSQNGKFNVLLVTELLKSFELQIIVSRDRKEIKNV